MSILTAEDRSRLLWIAGASLVSHLEGKEGPRDPGPGAGAVLFERYGAFVTLRSHGALRGCIGHVRARGPLWETVREMAVAAASRDHRFHPVSLDELPDLDLEITVLSPLEPVRHISEIHIGEHGLYITMGEDTGVLLPQVATEHGWAPETFLGQTCRKAGLDEGAWRRGAEVRRFRGEILSASFRETTQERGPGDA